MTPSVVEIPKVVPTEGVGTLAIELTDVYFKYGRTAKSPLILNGLSITILQGEIYALLGPSGCGKTTTLKCITKSVVPNSGTVLLPLNQTSKTRIPGTGVGFMPQELALFPDLTIRETLRFFGGINGIPTSLLRERIKKLTEVFELPPEYRYVGTLSGGQKRRVSLIAALLHDPQILVLDEPTVGIDPILRQTVWNYLLTLTKVENKTVLVTTHYIDEAKDAMTVGLMRDGRVLTESSPANLMNHFKEKSLEVCFYKLCLQGEKNRVDKELTGRRESDCPEFPMKPIHSFPGGFESTANLLASKINLFRREKHGSTPGNVATLIKKNLMLLKRSFMMLLFQFVLPALTVSLFGLCVGGRVFDLPVAIVNEETPPYFSGRFMKLLEKQPIIMTNFNTLDEGIASVKSGDSRVAIHIHRDFSHCLIKRLQHGLDVSNETLECSSVKLHMDATNQIIALDLQLLLWKTFEDFQRIMLVQLAVSESIAALPIVFSEPPIYGTLDVKFGEYVTPAIILICTHFLATILTAVSLVIEKESGVFERLKVNGVTKTQIFAAQLLTNLLVVIAQGILVLAVQFSFFDTPLHGSIFYVIAIILMQGYCGMVFGFFISSIANNVTSVLIIGLGVFYPNLFLCGLVWPIEGMPHVMRYFARFIPLTLTIESLRSILSRGWGLDSLTVWLGLISVTAWSGFFLIVAVLMFKLKK